MKKPKFPTTVDLERRQLLKVGGAAAVGALVACPVGVIEPDSGVLDTRFDAGMGFDGGVPDSALADAASGSDAATAPDASNAEDASVADAAQQGPPADPLFFVQLSDIHIGAQSLSTPYMAYCLGTVLPAVQPTATFATGDLVDFGDDSGHWDGYRNLVDGADLSASNFVEIPGNHCAKNDPDLNRFGSNTITGRAGGGSYGVHTFGNDQRRVRVVGLNTTDADFLRNLTGYLDGDQVDEIIGAIDADPTPVHGTIVLGHHPMKGIDGLELHNTDQHLDRLLVHTDGGLYLCGHVHIFGVSWHERTLLVQADTVGNPALFTGAPGFTLVAFDDDMAVRNVRLQGGADNPHIDWPLVIITRPASNPTGGVHRRTAQLPRASSGHLLRAGVFCHSGAPDDVSFRIEEGDWQPMNDVGGYYEALFDTPDAGHCFIEVRATACGATRSDAARIHLA